ncbi:uncharacterized protein ACN427_011335 isoform 1-T2 [Glossina fuscipes fuscipes]|nr:hypothetical protein GQX74_009985 [Glossina fuscipes]
MGNSRFIRTCIVRNCRRREGCPNIVLHSFPANIPLRLKWCENLRIGIDSINTRTRVCSRHFEPEFIGEHRRKLFPNAFPTLVLGYNGQPKHIRDFTPERKCKWKICCIKNCQSNPSDTYHYFPKDEVLKQMWVSASNTGRKLQKKIRICSQHFEPELLCAKKLKRFAVPTRNLNLKDDIELSNNGVESSAEGQIYTNSEKHMAKTNEDVLNFNEELTLEGIPTSTPIKKRGRNKSTSMVSTKTTKKLNTMMFRSKEHTLTQQEDEMMKLKESNLQLNNLLTLLKKCNKQLEDENKKLIDRLFQLKESNNKKDKQILKFKYTLRHLNIKVKTINKGLDNK